MTYYRESRLDAADNQSANILIVCHDTGSANALSVFARHLKNLQLDVGVVCSGTSATVFCKMGIQPDALVSDRLGLDDVLHLFDTFRPDAVVLGTSLDSRAERMFCREAGERGVFSLALVDWWSNFGRRFSTPGSLDLLFLPDAIAVEDEDAAAGALADGIPGGQIHITGNPYWDHLLGISEEYVAMTRHEIRTQLGVPLESRLGVIFSSNLRRLDLDLGYDESDFLDSIDPLPIIDEAGKPLVWFVKPHPKETIQELEALLMKYSSILQVIECSSIEAIAAADYVLGMCSSSLLEAVFLKRKVVSLQPGLKREKTEFLRVFHRLGVPEIVSAAEARITVNQLVNDKFPAVDPFRLLSPNARGESCGILYTLLINGIRGNG